MSIVALSLLTACVSKKHVASPEIRKAATAQMLYTALLDQNSDFAWFNAKARVRTVTDDLQVGGTIHIRMLRDSLIWARVEKFGFEVGRAYLESDSAFIIDRLSKVFYAESLREFTQEYKAPFSFDDLQQVLTGGALMTPYHTMTARKEKTRHILELNSSDLKTTHWFDKHLRLMRTAVLDRDGRSVTLTYGEYKKEAQKEIPYALHMELYDLESTTEISLHFTQIEFDVPQMIRFSIPAHYVKMD